MFESLKGRHLDIWNIYLFHRFKDKIIHPNGKNSMQNATCQNSWYAFQLDELFDAVRNRTRKISLYLGPFQTEFVRDFNLFHVKSQLHRNLYKLEKPFWVIISFFTAAIQNTLKNAMKIPHSSGVCEIGPRTSAQVSRSFGFWHFILTLSFD